MSDYVKAGLGSDFSPSTAGKVTSFRLIVDRAKLDSLGDDVRKRVSLAVRKAGLDIKGNAQKNIQAKNLIDTGNLLNSITIQNELDGLTARVLVGAYYGIYLEFGTVKMSAKPFLGPAFESVSAGFTAAIMQAFEDALK